jgi:hypothetical protein
MILNNGGLRSLVATALAIRDPEPQKTQVSLLHVIDGRDNGIRIKYVRMQAKQFQLTRIVEIDLRNLYEHRPGRDKDGLPIDTLSTPQVLLAALGQARWQQADQVIWPASFDGDETAMARATEQMVLIGHLAQIEYDPMPQLDAPLLELTDRQVLEVGAQLDLDWQLAKSCLAATDKPCHTCAACQRRKNAFAAAGMVDLIGSHHHSVLASPAH